MARDSRIVPVPLGKATFLDAPRCEDLEHLAGAGVQLQVCPNALHEHGIDPGTIPTFAQTNLGGVVALVLAHHEGFVYVKP